MKLFIHSGTSYLSESGSRSRAGGFPYLGDTEHSHNGSLGSIYQIMPNVLYSVAEAKYASFFTNSLRGCILQNILFDLGYPQMGTLISCDNTTATRVVEGRPQSSIVDELIERAAAMLGVTPE